ncbi:uncharacterized protein LOC130812637 isoform X1 [Amaranthus tricolor]|uniref:uncharacterized protein LOC130812637 isoform X1 n=1 Tax=Amaranthus tricolor TaxID=29722 RepID=UPI002590350A|nr:uncharacterized protein LOC130812637 isoform X1 [Amaranthus tricolor]
MALASCRMVVRASWDTQQIQPYNRNAPRKTNKKNKNKNQKSDLLSLFKPSTPTRTSQDNQSLKFDVDDLLNFKHPTISLQEPVKTEDSTYLGYERWLPSPPKVEKPRSSHNAAALAYIGDCIYELYARRHFLAPALSIEDYNDHVMAVVRCEAQDALLHKLCNGDFLSIEERDVLRWGKNITSAKTRTTKRAGVAVYNRASSLETLIGYLYLTNAERLEELMSKLGFSVGVSNQSILEGVKMELQNLKQKGPREKKPLPNRSKTLPNSIEAQQALL